MLQYTARYTEVGLCRRPFCVLLGSPPMREANCEDLRTHGRRYRPEAMQGVHGKPDRAGGPRSRHCEFHGSPCVETGFVSNITTQERTSGRTGRRVDGILFSATWEGSSNSRHTPHICNALNASPHLATGQGFSQSGLSTGKTTMLASSHIWSPTGSFFISSYHLLVVMTEQELPRK